MIIFKSISFSIKLIKVNKETVILKINVSKSFTVSVLSKDK